MEIHRVADFAALFGNVPVPKSRRLVSAPCSDRRVGREEDSRHRDAIVKSEFASERRRLEDEVAAAIEEGLAKLDRVSHPNVMKTHDLIVLYDDVGLIEARPTRGRSLNDLLYTLHSPSMARRLEWVGGLIAGLGALHKQNLLHGDLTSDKVRFNDDDEDAAAAAAASETPVITEYGLFRLYRRFVPEWAPNRRYAAPELVRDAEDGLSVQSDIFSLAIIIWQAITLQRPPNCSPPALSFVTESSQRSVLARCWDPCPWKRPELHELEAVFGN